MPTAPHRAPDPAFADTELAGSVSPFPLIGLARPGWLEAKPTPPAPSNSLLFDFTNPERTHRARAERRAATREADRLQAEQAQRTGEAARDAYRHGKADGFREGHAKSWQSGTNWGIFCGLFMACLLGAIAVMSLVMLAGRHAPWL